MEQPPVRAALREWVAAFLESLTVDIRDRSVGSDGNRTATAYFEGQLKAAGWATEAQRFDAIDWQHAGATLTAVGDLEFQVFPSPYSLGCEAFGRLETASTIEELETVNALNALLLLHGDIAREPLMPKNFPFFNIDEHQRIIALLESSCATAILCAPSAHGRPAGAPYPTPMIEDGDFSIPSVFMTEEEGERLLRFAGRRLTLTSNSQRIRAEAANIIGRINDTAPQRIVVTAHIDAKKDVPGALDNGTGIAILLLLSKLLARYRGKFCIELVALNGEDHYAVPGQIAYMATNRGAFGNIALNINVDGVGYIEGETAFSFFRLPSGMTERATAILLAPKDTCEGIEWLQGDHSMFIQSGCPAIAVASNWLLENMAAQTITHTLSDHIDRVDPNKVVSCALSLKRFIEVLS